MPLLRRGDPAEEARASIGGERYPFEYDKRQHKSPAAYQACVLSAAAARLEALKSTHDTMLSGTIPQDQAMRRVVASGHAGAACHLQHLHSDDCQGVSCERRPRNIQSFIGVESDPDASVIFKLPVAAELLPKPLLAELQAALASGMASGKGTIEQPPPGKLRQQARLKSTLLSRASV